MQKEKVYLPVAATVRAVSYTHLVKNLGSRENEEAIARNLYAVLREFDEEEVSVIFSESFAAQGIGKAIMNRLEKAAGHVMLPAAAIVKQQKYLSLIHIFPEMQAQRRKLFQSYHIRKAYCISC